MSRQRQSQSWETLGKNGSSIGQSHRPARAERAGASESNFRKSGAFAHVNFLLSHRLVASKHREDGSLGEGGSHRPVDTTLHALPRQSTAKARTRLKHASTLPRLTPHSAFPCSSAFSIQHSAFLHTAPYRTQFETVGVPHWRHWRY